ncbi:MAG: sugar phosphate nucleotidyltransferase [Candidatus Delongbacteria bacterium]|nr:sugar phosphate nucleotidyltransferase [Candidatus Delongbacteria bacterium]
MKIIIPMAGMGKRMRPHTLNVPKPLIPVAGKPIVQHLVENIADVVSEGIEEIAFVIGDFDEEIKNQLKEIAGRINAKSSFFYQEEALGTAHAIQCAADAMDGKIVVAFADTLFKADFKLNDNHDATIWVQKVKNPSSFGVVKLGDSGQITDFIEKPKTFVSDLAIIGIYYFKEGEKLRNAIQYLLDNKITGNGEYQLTDALENMNKQGVKFYRSEVIEWMDCGNKNATVHTNQRMLHYLKHEDLISDKAGFTDSVIIPPCYIGKNAKIHKSVVGPYVSIGENTQIQNSIIENSIIRDDAIIENTVLTNSLIGNFTIIKNHANDLSIGDYTKINNS